MRDPARRYGNLRAVQWPMVIGGLLIAYAAGCAFGLLFESLGWWIGGGAWERDLLVAVHKTVSTELDYVMLWLPYLGTNYTLEPFVLVAAIVLWLKGYRAVSVHMAVIQTGSAMLNAAVKDTFGRPRPTLFEMRGQFALAAFPSGHSLAVASVMLTAAYLMHRYTGQSWLYWIVGVFFVLNSYSRVYLAVHWPTDVIAGTVIGLLWFAGCAYAFRNAHPSPFKHSAAPR